MRIALLLPLLALATGGCAGYGAQPTTPYRAIGTEPFWDLTIDRNLVFTDRGNERSVTEPTPRAVATAAGRTYRGRRLAVTIVHAPCSDGMSDRTYPDRVTLTVDGQYYRGCGADPLFFRRTAP